MIEKDIFLNKKLFGHTRNSSLISQNDQTDTFEQRRLQRRSKTKSSKKQKQNLQKMIKFEQTTYQSSQKNNESIAAGSSQLRQQRRGNRKQVLAEKDTEGINQRQLSFAEGSNMSVGCQNVELLVRNTRIMLAPILNKNSVSSRVLKQRRKCKQSMTGSIGNYTQKHVRISSQKAIRYFPQEQRQSSDLEQRNEESSLQNVEMLLTDLSREFQYVGDFSLIRKEVVQLALSKKLTILQNTKQFLTIKASSRLDYCQCLINSCLNLQESSAIYQLKDSICKRNKAKFILISGDQKQYLKFFRKMLIRLWDGCKLKLKQKQIVQFFVDVQKEDNTMKQLRKQYIQLYNQLSGLNGQKRTSVSSKISVESLFSGITKNIKRLRSPQKDKKPVLIDKYTELMELNRKTNQKFTCLRLKLLQSQNLPDVDQQTLEKQLQAELYFHQLPIQKLFGFYYKDEFQLFNAKKQQILHRYSFREMFSYLEIEEQYSLFLTQKGRLNTEQQVLACGQDIKSLGNIGNKQEQVGNKPSPVYSPVAPYKQCIKILQQMNTNAAMPTKLLICLQQFYKQLQTSYTQLYSQRPIIKFSSMDDELPITIYIILMSQLGYKSASMNYLGKIRWLVKWVQYQESYSQSAKFDGQSSSIYGRQGFQLERKILTILEAAMIFVAKEWKF